MSNNRFLALFDAFSPSNQFQCWLEQQAADIINDDAHQSVADRLAPFLLQHNNHYIILNNISFNTLISNVLDTTKLKQNIDGTIVMKLAAWLKHIHAFPDSFFADSGQITYLSSDKANTLHNILARLGVIGNCISEQRQPEPAPMAAPAA